MTITPDQAMSFAEEATLKVETLTHIEKDQVFYSLVSDDGHTVATDLDKGDAELLAIAPDLAQTIAGMEWQHAVEVYNADAKCWIQASNWIGNKELAEQDIDAYSRAYGGTPTRLVRRLVGPVEVAE